MAFYLDSAIVAQAQKVAEWGWVKGITTNPSLLTRSEYSPETTLLHLAAAMPGASIFYQLTAPDVDNMLRETERAQKLLGSQLVLKIPATTAGLAVCARLSPQMTVAVTTVYHMAQAMAASAAGAHYLFFYHDRALRRLEDGHQLAGELVRSLSGTSTQIIAASIKSLEEILAVRMVGVTHLSVPFEILEQIGEYDPTLKDVETFQETGSGLLEE
jgi:transaldolase